MKSITHLPDDLFKFTLKEYDLSQESVDVRKFTDVGEVNFLSVRLPDITIDKKPSCNTYQGWPEESKTFPVHSILDFEKKSGKREILFPFLMFASKGGTSLCSLHVSDIPKLRDVRPPFLVMVNAGKRTKTGFIRPFIEYREYVVHPALRSVVSSFYSNYQSLMRSRGYHHEIIDTQVEDIFSDENVQKEKMLF